MGTFAAATAELARLQTIAGLSAIRHAPSESTNSGGTDNMVLVKDSRIPAATGTLPTGGANPNNWNQAASIETIAGESIGDEYSGARTTVVGRWIVYEVGSAGTYWNSSDLTR